MMKFKYKKELLNPAAIILAILIVVDVFVFFALKKDYVFPFFDAKNHIRKSAYTDEIYTNSTIKLGDGMYECDEEGNVREAKGEEIKK